MTFFKNVPHNLPVEPKPVSPGKQGTRDHCGAKRTSDLPAAAMRKRNSLPSAAGSELLTVRDVAMIMRQSPATIYRLADRRAIQFLRFPHGLRFRRADVDAYLSTLVVEATNHQHL